MWYSFHLSVIKPLSEVWFFRQTPPSDREDKVTVIKTSQTRPSQLLHHFTLDDKKKLISGQRAKHRKRFCDPKTSAPSCFKGTVQNVLWCR